MQTATRQTVLVVNDDPLQLRVTAAHLAKDGLQVLPCQSAEEALALLRQGASVDVIVTDLHMPHIDGWRFCRLLRSPEYEVFNQVPILVLSATFSGSDAEQMSTELGANAFLAVPYDPAALRTHVRMLLIGETVRVPLRVLLVEDSLTLGTLLGRVFRKHGYTVDLAMTGAEAQRCLQDYRPDIVIIDYHLPDMTGDQLLRECCECAHPLVTIMMTSNPTPELALHFMRLGAHGYVRKPFDPAYLLDICVKALRERALLHVEELLETRTRALRVSEAQFRLLFDSIPDAVLVHEDNGTILAVNDVGARWLDYPAATLPGRSLSSLLTPDALPALARARTASPPLLKTTCVTRTGHRMAVEVTTRAITFHGKDALVSVMRDVTERERAVAALQAAKEYAENIINSSLDMIVSVDTQRQIIAFNTAAQLTFGYSADEVLGHPVHMLYAHPEVSGSIHQHALDKGHFTGEILNRRKDGSIFASYLSASVLRDAHGQVLGVMGISRDITARKHAEAALQASKEAAEAANRSKSEFLANVSHEIRTPMNGILGMTALALGTSLNAEQREYMELVKISAEALLGVIDDLLDFSKIEAGKLLLDARDFALRTSFNETIKTLLVPASHRGLELTCTVHPEVPDKLIGDVGRLRQILVNLVGNAIKFTQKGAIVVRVDPARADDSPAAEQRLADTCLLHVSVQDTGIGIPSDRQQAIFEPFVQADGSTTRRYGGTGLGLSIAAQLVALMGGRIWVESTPGVGSTFHFTACLGRQSLPLTPPGLHGGERTQHILAAHVAPPLPAAACPAEPACHLLHILLAEDNVVNQRLAVRLLEKRGHTVTVVQDGLEALGIITEQPFDLILMDIQMPHMDGLEATQAIRRQEQETGTHVPIVAMTAHAMQGDRERCLAAGMDGYLTKPLHPAELFELIDTLPAAAAVAAEQPMLDHQTLWERVDGDPELLQEIIGLFLTDCPERLRELQDALARQDCQQLARVAHRFKGSISNISAVKALEAVRHVEASAQEGDVTGATSALATLEAEIARLTPALTALPAA